MNPFVFVTVGTDHHAFDRLISWVDTWAAADAGRRCLVQSGTSRSPEHAQASAYMGYAEMGEAMRNAVAVVCHGGPATIMEARHAGRLPIVVPRRHALGEHVDDHQVRFAARLAEHGQIELVADAEALAAHLDRALADPDAYRLTGEGGHRIHSVARFGAALDALLDGNATRRRRAAPAVSMPGGHR